MTIIILPNVKIYYILKLSVKARIYTIFVNQTRLDDWNTFNGRSVFGSWILLISVLAIVRQHTRLAYDDKMWPLRERTRFDNQFWSRPGTMGCWAYRVWWLRDRIDWRWANIYQQSTAGQRGQAVAHVGRLLNTFTAWRLVLHVMLCYMSWYTL